MKRLLILPGVALIIGAMFAPVFAQATPFPPSSREIKIVDRDPTTNLKHTITILATATDRVYITQHEAAIIHPDGTETETTLQDPRNISISRSK